MQVGIQSLGHYTPPKILDNEELSKLVDTNDEWIVSRTGIKERRMADQETTSDMAIKAGRDCLGSDEAKDIDLLIASCGSPDKIYPTQSAQIANALPLPNATVIDINIACSGLIGGMILAQSMIQSGQSKRAMVTGSEKMSAYMDYTDRANCILFGDAGAAVLLEPTTDLKYGFQDSILKVDGSGRESLYMKGGGSLNPSSHETVDKNMHVIYQDGKVVFKAAVKGMADISYDLMEKNNLKGDDIAYLVPHQANLRIIDATAKRMGVGRDKVMINIQKYGNTTSATIPLCLVEYYRDGKVKKGDKLILSAFGAGYTWGASLLVWSMD